MCNQKVVIHRMICVCFPVLLVTYLGFFGWLNLAKLAEHADSDTAIEVLLAREIWEEKVLCPNNWISGTERRMVSPAAIGAFHYYFFAVFFVEAAAVGCLMDILCDRYRALWICSALFICGYATANLAYTYVPAAVSDNRQDKMREVSLFLQDSDIRYGYARFWNANRLTVVSEGQVTMGGVYDMSNLTMYWWLTNVKWYVPALPEDMAVAYVVTPAEEEGFLSGIGIDVQMTRAFENEDF